MGLFKEKMTYKDTFPGVLVKTAGLKLDEDKPGGWRKAIDAYMVEKFPTMAEDFGSVNFKNVDESSGSAIGEVIYNRGVNVIIPIIVDDFTVKDVDLAIVDNRVIPLNRKYIDMLTDGSQSVGVEVHKDDNLSTGMSFISSIFDDTSYDREGNPIGQSVKTAMKQSTLDRVNKAFEEAEWETDLSKILKTATAKNSNEAVIDIFAEEDHDNPYHYEGAIMTKKASGELVVEDVYLDGVELARIEGQLSKRASEDVSIVPIKIDSRKVDVKKATKTGYYDKLFGEKAEGRVFVVTNPPSLIPGTAGTKSFAIFKEFDGSTPLGGGDNINPITYWMNGEVFTGKPTGEHNYIGDKKDMADVLELMGRYIVFNMGGVLSEPYKVNRVEQPHSLLEDDHRLILDVENTKNREVRLWVIPQINKVSKANKKNMAENGFAHEAGYDGDVYAVPGSYDIIPLPEKQKEAMTPETIATSITKEASGDNAKKFKMKDMQDDTYRVNIDGDISFMTKTAALLHARQYISPDIESMDDFDTNDGTYLYKVASYGNPDLKVLDKTRGEWIKIASVINDNKLLMEKIANIEGVVSQLVGVDLLDDSSNLETDEIITQLMNMIDRIGQLLVLARASRIELSEYALTKAFKALSQLVNEIRG